MFLLLLLLLPVEYWCFMSFALPPTPYPCFFYPERTLYNKLSTIMKSDVMHKKNFFLFFPFDWLTVIYIDGFRTYPLTHLNILKFFPWAMEKGWWQVAILINCLTFSNRQQYFIQIQQLKCFNICCRYRFFFCCYWRGYTWIPFKFFI